MSEWKNVQYKDGKMRTSEGGGGGGSSTFAGLDDVSFNNLQNGQVPKYNSTTQKWENANESGGGGTVTDVQVDGVSVVNQQGVAEIPAIPDGLHHYSTTEQVIGTWIDGKPIYEKTFTGLSQSIRSKDWNVITGISIPNIKDAIYVRAIRLTGSGNLADIGLIEYASNVNSQSVQVNPIDTQTLNYLIVQYTKTTD